MMVMRKPAYNELPSENKMAAQGLATHDTRSPAEKKSPRLFSVDGLSIDQQLLTRTRAICEKYQIHFAELSTIQRKFVTHYRCNKCGLLPLYNLDLLHVKRVRCRKCGELVAFKRKGKYGKLRKEIAVELMKEI